MNLGCTDLHVGFAGTGQEPDVERGRTNVVRLLESLEGTALYEPGIGTWETRYRQSARAIGFGLVARVDDVLDRMHFHMVRHPVCRVNFFGESRGAYQAVLAARRFKERYGQTAHVVGLFDMVVATGWKALRRVLPRRVGVIPVWFREVVERPPCAVLVHLLAGEEPDRRFAHDWVEPADGDWVDVLKFCTHSEVIRGDYAQHEMLRQISAHGLDVRDVPAGIPELRLAGETA